MNPRVFFDLDGTLTDPYEGISKCFIYAVETLGYPRPSEEYLLSAIGPPLYDTFPPVVGEELTRQAVDLYRERFNDVGWLENKPYDGIHDALSAVAETGCRMFVATSKPRVAAIRIVDHFEMRQYFERVFGSELDGTHSNKADLLRYALAETEDDSDSLMIGDRKHDLIGAIANELIPVGVSYGYGSVDELNSAGATAIAHTPIEIPTVIAQSIASAPRFPTQ